jgi:hypothetical protein
MGNSPSDLDEGMKQRGLARTNRGFQCSQSFKDLSKEGYSPITYYRMGVWGGMRTYQSFRSNSLCYQSDNKKKNWIVTKNLELPGTP